MLAILFEVWIYRRVLRTSVRTRFFAVFGVEIVSEIRKTMQNPREALISHIACVCVCGAMQMKCVC
jgi:hypothetical protein